MQMYLLLPSDPINQAGRAANYRSCTLEPSMDVEPGHERGSASPRGMTSGLGKQYQICFYWSWAFWLQP